jgi:hypothetical protein
MNIGQEKNEKQLYFPAPPRLALMSQNNLQLRVSLSDIKK